MYIASMGRVLVIKMCFDLNPELQLSFFPLLFMISERKKRFLIFSGDLVCSLQLGVSKESRVTLRSVYTLRE